MQVETIIGGGGVRFKHDRGTFTVAFHRTLRLPEDGKAHALPPSLGRLPVKMVDDYKDRVPPHWVAHGGVFMPLHEREAMWMSFQHGLAPCAVKVAAGKVNAVSGKPWSEELSPDDKDYMVAPPQPWLDGFNAGDGLVKQFVAMKMGQGYTVEGQVTGEEKHGGIQLLVIPPKEGALKPEPASRGIGGEGGCAAAMASMEYSAPATVYANAAWIDSEQEVKTSGGILRSAEKTKGGIIAAGLTKAAEMGLAAGGRMRQKIYSDPHGIEVWDQAAKGRIFVHVINAELYKQITGEQPPAMPQSAQSYGGSWYDTSDDHLGDIAAPQTLTDVKTVAEKDKEHGFVGQQDDSPIGESASVKYTPSPGYTKTSVRDGDW